MAIADGRYYVIAAEELALWIERQSGRWWEVDGDAILTGIVSFPCPSDELAVALRRVSGDLHVRARPEDEAANGTRIESQKLDDVVSVLGEDVEVVKVNGGAQAWLGDRVFWLSWAHVPAVAWMLCEDEQIRRAALRDEEAAAARQE